MVSIPEAFVISPPGLVKCGKEHGHDGDGQNVARPARTCQEVELDKAYETSVALGGELGDIVQMSDSVDPRKDDQ